jgi:hypothetical protein
LAEVTAAESAEAESCWSSCSQVASQALSASDMSLAFVEGAPSKAIRREERREKEVEVEVEEKYITTQSLEKKLKKEAGHAHKNNHKYNYQNSPKWINRSCS